tara:strand:+ start:390 stop:926 length:537 start_codon:yes stop_codon:yes gene_type:complete
MKENEYKEPKWVRVRTAAILSAILIFMVGVGVWQFVQIERSRQKRDLTKVILANTEIMDANAQLFKQMKKNADTMMRYYHYLDGHDPSVEKVIFCPECWTEEDTPTELSDHFVTEFEDYPEEVPETFEQLLKDCKEIKTSIQTAKSSLFSQSVTLEHTLDKLKAQNSLRLGQFYGGRK